MIALLIIALAMCATISTYCCFRQVKKADCARGETIMAWADLQSYKNMYGPNLMSRIPPMTGMVSDGVLVDIRGKGNMSDFTIGHYNLNDKSWTFEPRDWVTDAEYPYVIKNGRWYRLPLAKYERERNG